MTSLLEIPNYELAAKSLHSTSHEVVDSIPGFICTETTSNTSFTEGNILRVKEIRCDRNNGKIRTTGIVISNKNQVQAGQIVPDSAIYDNVGGFTTAKIVTFDNTVNNSALVIRSGGAYIEDGAIVVGTVTTNQLTVNGTSVFTQLMNINYGLSGNIIYGTLQAFLRVQAPEIGNGTDSNTTYKRNGNAIVTLEKTTVAETEIKSFTLSPTCYLKRTYCPRLCVARQIPNQTGTSTCSNGQSVFISPPTYGTYLIDNEGNFGSSRFTAPVAGVYRFFYTTMRIDNQTSYVTVFRLHINGVASNYEFSCSHNGYVSPAITYETLITLNTGDNVSVVNSSGVTITLDTRSFLGCYLVSTI